MDSGPTVLSLYSQDAFIPAVLLPHAGVPTQLWINFSRFTLQEQLNDGPLVLLLQVQCVGHPSSFSSPLSFPLGPSLRQGLDIVGVRSVVNFHTPRDVTTYVHRVGRTARAGRGGVAVTFAGEKDRQLLKGLVRAGLF